MGKATRSTLVANSPLCKMYELGLSDGEAKGRRLERQALMLAMPVLIRKSGTAKFSLPLRNWLASRSKRGKVGK